MPIHYQDNLVDACTDTVIASYALTAPRSIGTPVDLDFKFIISYQESRVNSQCEAFLNLVRSNPDLTSTIDKYISLEYSKRNDVIKNSYKYSLFKVLYSIRELINAGYNFYGAVPSNSYVFYGHKVLFYTFMDHNTFTPALSMSANVYLNKTIRLDEDIFDVIERDPVFKDCINEAYPGGIFNRDYERILKAFKEVNGFEVSLLSDRNDIPADPLFNPLGSMAFTNKAKKPLLFSSEDDSIATVSTPRSLTDANSKFWNTANCISILEMPAAYQDASRGTPYTFIKKDLVSSFTVFAEVEAITGLHQKGLYTTYGLNIPKPSGGGLTNVASPGPFGPIPASPTGWFSNLALNGSSGNGNPKPPIVPSNNSRQNKVLKDVVSNTAKGIGRAVTSLEARALLTSAATSFFEHQLTERRINSLLNSLSNSQIISDNQSNNVNLGILSSQSNQRSIEYKKPKPNGKT